MTYPLSNEVNVGDATEASQYNNLRTDALYLGEDPAASGTVRDLLVQQMSGIRLSRDGKTQIKLTASEDDPAAVVIGGKICTKTADASVTVTAFECPVKGRYYVYAAAGSGTFALGVGAAAPEGCRIIGTFLWSGTGIIPGSVKDIRSYETIRDGRDRKKADGRLTLASGVPVPESDITTAKTVYFTPYNGNEIGLKVGTEWELFEFQEISIPLTGLVAEMPYDVFIGADENGLSLSLEVWGSAMARLTPLVYSDGVPVSAADDNRRYLGSIAVDSAGNCKDSKADRLIWNRNNQVPRALLSTPPDIRTASQHQNVWSPYFDSDAPEVRILIPLAETDMELTGVGISSYIQASDATYTRGIAVGIGLDMEMESPYTANNTCVPVFCASFGNGPVTVNLRNSSATFRGFHRYTLAFWTNYTYAARGMSFTTLIGETPGLYGKIMG